MVVRNEPPGHYSVNNQSALIETSGPSYTETTSLSKWEKKEGEYSELFIERKLLSNEDLYLA